MSHILLCPSPTATSATQGRREGAGPSLPGSAHLRTPISELWEAGPRPHGRAHTPSRPYAPGFFY